VASKFRGNWGDVEFNHGLEMKLSQRNYKPQFEPDTSDWFARFRYKAKLKSIGVQVHKAVTDQQAASFDHWKRTRVDRRKRRRATGADRTRKILEKRLAELPVRSAGDQLMQEAAETLGLGAAARRSEMDLDR
jgi:acyl-CoA reductase-like NAD-dependent aldehyde dehydrogenase